MGQRSRKRGQRQKAPSTVASPAGAAYRSRSEQKNAAVRAGLKPLGPGERPWPITVGALLAAASGISQLVLYIVGVRLKTSGLKAAAGQTIVFAVLMLVCAAGMWWLRYWAVLGFMALLAILVTFAVGSLITASSVLGAVVAVAIVGGGGYLFFKLVRVLSRIQMPKFPGS
ncbi:MAG: hypothetical protein ACJ764_09625 [Solirubrobacteraceae bacterium]